MRAVWCDTSIVQEFCMAMTTIVPLWTFLVMLLGTQNEKQNKRRSRRKKLQKKKIDERTTKIERKLRVIFNVGSIIMLLAVLTVEALAKKGIYLVKTLLILLVVVMMMLCWAVWAYCNSQVESIHIALNEWKLNVRINGCFGLPCILAVSYHDTLSLY